MLASAIQDAAGTGLARRTLIVLDEGAKISRTYGTSKFPESYLIDRDGRLRLKFVGPRNWMEPSMGALLESYGARRKG